MSVLCCAFLLASCSTSHSCSRAGNTSWPWASDYQNEHRVTSCETRKIGDGKKTIDGEYVEYFDDGQVALEGNFKKGQKDGLWTQYDPHGKKVMELYFKDGFELDTSTGKPASVLTRQDLLAYYAEGPR